jgi:hypothetical protein
MRITKAQSSRRHRVGTAKIRFVMANAHTIETRISSRGEVQIWWIGDDESGREIEVMAYVQPGRLVIAHAMPTHYRRKGK